MRDYKYALDIMKQEVENQYISPEIKYAFESSIEALEKQIFNDELLDEIVEDIVDEMQKDIIEILNTFKR